MRGAGSRVKRPRPKRGGEEGEGAKGPQAESTLTYALPSLVGKWFTGIGCQGSPGFRAHFDLSGSFGASCHIYNCEGTICWICWTIQCKAISK